MTGRYRFALAALAVFSLAGLSTRADAGTILKLGLGGDPPADIEFDGITMFTVDDGDPATAGDQNTNIEFLDFLSGIPDILTPTASFTLSDLVPFGSAIVVGPIVIQTFMGGTLELYDPANTLLLSATLTASALTGPLGPPATGAVFTTGPATVTGGTLAAFINPADSLTLSMSFTDINGGSGFSVGGPGPALGAFTADATLNMAAVPEPETAVLLVAGAVMAALSLARRRRW